MRLTPLWQVLLHGKPVELLWARTRRIHKETWNAIRHGATRNLYIANVPEHVTEAQIIELFTPCAALQCE